LNSARRGRRHDQPGADPRELMMDIARHVPDVEVLRPEELTEAVRNRLRHGFEMHATLVGLWQTGTS
jgi:predicted DNA-binding transcriptional regulator YafY